MTYHPENIAKLILKSFEETLTSMENAELQEWLAISPENRQLFHSLESGDFTEIVSLLDQEHLDTAHDIKNKLYTKINNNITTSANSTKEPVNSHSSLLVEISPPTTSSSKQQLIRKWGWVAASVLLIAAGLYILKPPTKQPVLIANVPANVLPNDVAPGSNKAKLTLEDGTEIYLDSNAHTLLANRGISNNNALISYADATVEPGLNTLSTPRGGQYKLQLSDGTTVWLNAASSITYPAIFDSHQRKVQISGEVYLEVAGNPSKPFIVQAGKSQVQVLGTSFNINAYPDEDFMRTTLLEGSVMVMAGNTRQLLMPGQQIKVSTIDASSEIIDTASLESVIAWKNGTFNFHQAGLDEVLRQLARWYDLEIVYEKSIPRIYFGGEMSRSMKLSEVLRSLKDVNVKFRLEDGKRLIVLP